jgi:RimJ/RimL family protein N-acetyltransferase
MSITIEPLRPEDSDTLFAWVNDREVISQSSTVFNETPRDAHDIWFEQAMVSGTVWTVRDDDDLVGLGQLIVEGHEAEMRLRLGANGSRSRGVGRLAALEILRKGFAELGLRRVWSQVPKYNERALNLNRRIGFEQFGQTDEVILFDQGPEARSRKSEP